MWFLMLIWSIMIEPIPSAVVDGNLTIDGTISPSNTITAANIVALIDTRDVVALDASTNAITIADDYTSAFTNGVILEARNSTNIDGDHTVVSSTFDGTFTTISVVAPRNLQNIISVNTILKTFTIAGDQTAIDQVGELLPVTGAGANDGTYTINTQFFDGVNTILTVDEVITVAVATGVISLLSEIDDTIIDGYVTIIDGLID